MFVVYGMMSKMMMLWLFKICLVMMVDMSMFIIFCKSLKDYGIMKVVFVFVDDLGCVVMVDVFW